MKNHTLFKKFETFIKQIEKKDKIALLHDKDADGVTAGIIFADSIKKLRGRKIDYVTYIERRINQFTPRMIKRLKKYDYVVVLDFAQDRFTEEIKILLDKNKRTKIIIIDHHTLYNDLNKIKSISNKVLLIKPKLIQKRIEDSQYCVSKLVYDLFSYILDISEYDWLAAIGIIGDAGYKTWKDFMDEVFEKYKIEKKKDIFETDLGKLSNLICYAESEKTKNIKEVFKIFYRKKDYKKILNSKLKRFKKIEKTVNYFYDNYKKLAEFYPNTIFYFIKSKYKIGAILANRLSRLHKNKNFFLLQERKGGRVGVNARRQDCKVSMNKVMEESIKGLENANGGGHVPAAGGSFNTKDYEKFKENLIENLKKIRAL